jgi:hypothetical protein
MMFRKINAVYSENHMKHIGLNDLCGKNAKLLNVKAGGTYVTPVT